METLITERELPISESMKEVISETAVHISGRNCISATVKDALRTAAAKLIFSTVAGQSMFQRAIGGPRDVSFVYSHGLMKGMSFRCQSSNRYFVLREAYEREMLTPLQRLVRPGMTVYEIGAHFGFWALALSRLVGPSGKVFAFEPSLSNLRVLRANVEANRCGNVEVVPMALSDTEGTISFTDDGSMSRVADSGGQVRATTIDAFCVRHPRPDFILMDVEGHGASVLKGASRTLAGDCCPMICEIHGTDEAIGVLSFLQGKRPIDLAPLLRGFPCRAVL